MNFKKSFKDVAVLVAICVVFATILAAVNSVTAPIIADRLNAAANEAYMAVMPGAKGFEDVDLSGYTVPASVKEAKRETSGMGYAIKLEAKGYSTGMVLIVGVSSDGVVTGATCIASNETWGLETSFGDKTVGKDINTIVDVEAGATSLTINGYRAAVKDAINAAAIFGGASVDIRTEEEKFADALAAALPDGEGKFTKLFITENIDGINSVYAADNGKGYVCVIGNDSTGTFIGVGADGVAINGGDNKAVAEAAVKAISGSDISDVDISEFKNSDDRNIKKVFRSVNSVKKTATGNYVIEVKVTGYHDNLVVKVAISADGKILDAQTVSHEETPNIGGTHLVDGKYNSNFIGKTEEEANGVDTIAGCTMTTDGFKKAITRAFETLVILGGGTVDTRTEEEILADNLNIALPEGEGKFTKVFVTEVITGVDKLYSADNGKGYVCIIGTEFIAVGEDGAAIGESANKAVAEAAVNAVSESVVSDLDITEYVNSADRNIKKVFRNIKSVKVTASGNYIVEAKVTGYHDNLIVKVAISAEGKILDAQTVSHEETPNIGGTHLVDGKYNSNFIGKTEEEAGKVDTIAGCTMTTDGFKKGVARAFEAVVILEGGAN